MLMSSVSLQLQQGSQQGLRLTAAAEISIGAAAVGPPPSALRRSRNRRNRCRSASAQTPAPRAGWVSMLLLEWLWNAVSSPGPRTASRCAGWGGMLLLEWLQNAVPPPGPADSLSLRRLGQHVAIGMAKERSATTRPKRTYLHLSDRLAATVVCGGVACRGAQSEVIRAI